MQATYIVYFLINQGPDIHGFFIGDAAGVRPPAGVDGRGEGHGVPPGAAARVQAGPHRHLQAWAQAPRAR